MKLPQNVLKVIEEALESVETDIDTRNKNGEEHTDLDLMKSELNEMKLEKRKEASDILGRIIIDSMDWNQPSLKKFNEVVKLLRSFYRLRP